MYVPESESYTLVISYRIWGWATRLQRTLLSRDCDIRFSLRHPRRDLEDSSITSPSFLPRRSRLSRLLRSTTDTATATATDTDIDTDTDTDTDTELRPASLSLPIDGPSLVSRHMHSQHAKDRAPPKPPKC
ncbi:hypothetical protein E4U35_001453 [Claviceps purpurea]|nr:hypothetical protein E4U51_001134 [Claviceps purpurea]KAG6206737.1 hypothetical protein E4U35_001453 [Claviceps purpurea]